MEKSVVRAIASLTKLVFISTLQIVSSLKQEDSAYIMYIADMVFVDR